MIISQLIDRAREYLPPSKIAIVERAYEFANRAHEGQVRKSGEPYIEHPLQTALILVELELDANSLAAALLHDVTENCGIPTSEIEAQFGSEVAKLVGATTKLGKISWQEPEDTARRGGATGSVQAENLRKMLVAMAEDLRGVFFKLADRLHNMRTLYAPDEDKQQRSARETLGIYAPLAHRWGIWAVTG
ncbi:MAG: bifunctional (p)ppGpp synthetase/guanosine-3',5'-bis(diphosphate) 3'-pyrophosphohydrolase, partial [Dehalococcoidia bacterium]|nr:bifunctional (p)ppGpp synthetase/guanosine-3',5'-bis(diphosphate) 3'-pyrophosphohydrolase [Dehalococcoidia bacterium]